MSKAAPIATIAVLLEGLKFVRSFSAEVRTIGVSSEMNTENFHLKIFAPITCLEVGPCDLPHLLIKCIYDFDGRRSMPPDQLYSCLEALPPSMHVGFEIKFDNDPKMQRFTLNQRRTQTVDFVLFPSHIGSSLSNIDGRATAEINIRRKL